ncbi:mechanosensitive ion channel family protein [Kordia sp. YSTF-M3]|uniref:Mechanosensitive ion channel family protein n=1 Tax=Kordia aestuariivivens TaxID=2759037 RepID=A0ABR7Q466_9FLAO|nr:mechanosensitive ion channel family protein [Kordia aestuariivivens]MBC8753139.1 mechanosensitive ion channel family protein [Kordia aestuariivivens]
MEQGVQATTGIVIDKLESWWVSLVENLPNIGVAIIVLILSYFLSRLVFKTTLKLIDGRVKQKAVAKLIARVVAVFVVLTGLFLALSVLNLGESISGLLTGAGISGIVIGLALQGTLSNTISGIVLSFRKNVRIGNWVETTGYAGEVIDIALNYLVLKEADNNIVVIPNKTILENPIKNYSLTTRMRVMIDCGVGYESDLEAVEKITKNVIANSFEQIESTENVEFYYTEFGGSSINFLCRFWIDAENSLEQLKAKSKAIMKIKQAFEKENINIPFPIRTLKFNDQTLKVSKAEEALET